MFEQYYRKIIIGALGDRFFFVNRDLYQNINGIHDKNEKTTK